MKQQVESLQRTISGQNFCKVTESRISLLSFYNGLFHGEILKGKCSGRGVFWWNSGELYFGEWEENLMQGEGIFFFPYGGYLKGVFFKNKINGAAFLKFPNGDFYEGFWRHGKLDGKCFKYFADYDSWALCIYSKGIFQECLNKGRGRPNISFEEKLNATIEASYQNPKEDEVGILSFSDGGKYYGLIQSGLPHGIGILYYKDGKFDAGTFVNGLLNGIGRMNMQNGDTYEGHISQGQLHGKGFFYKKDVNKWVLRKFVFNNPGDIEDKGSGFPLEAIMNWRTKKHVEDGLRVQKSIPNDIFSIPLLESHTSDTQSRKRGVLRHNADQINIAQRQTLKSKLANSELIVEPMRELKLDSSDTSSLYSNDNGQIGDNSNKENQLGGNSVSNTEKSFENSPELLPQELIIEQNVQRNLYYLQTFINKQRTHGQGEISNSNRRSLNQSREEIKSSSTVTQRALNSKSELDKNLSNLLNSRENSQMVQPSNQFAEHKWQTLGKLPSEEAIEIRSRAFSEPPHSLTKVKTNPVSQSPTNRDDNNYLPEGEKTPVQYIYNNVDYFDKKAFRNVNKEPSHFMRQNTVQKSIATNKNLQEDIDNDLLLDDKIMKQGDSTIPSSDVHYKDAQQLDKPSDKFAATLRLLSSSDSDINQQQEQQDFVHHNFQVSLEESKHQLELDFQNHKYKPSNSTDGLSNYICTGPYDRNNSLTGNNNATMIIQEELTDNGASSYISDNKLHKSSAEMDNSIVEIVDKNDKTSSESTAQLLMDRYKENMATHPQNLPSITASLKKDYSSDSEVLSQISHNRHINTNIEKSNDSRALISGVQHSSLDFKEQTVSVPSENTSIPKVKTKSLYNKLEEELCSKYDVRVSNSCQQHLNRQQDYFFNQKRTSSNTISEKSTKDKDKQDAEGTIRKGENHLTQAVQPNVNLNLLKTNSAEKRTSKQENSNSTCKEDSFIENEKCLVKSSWVDINQDPYLSNSVREDRLDSSKKSYTSNHSTEERIVEKEEETVFVKDNSQSLDNDTIFYSPKKREIYLSQNAIESQSFSGIKKGSMTKNTCPPKVLNDDQENVNLPLDLENYQTQNDNAYHHEVSLPNTSERKDVAGVDQDKTTKCEKKYFGKNQLPNQDNTTYGILAFSSNSKDGNQNLVGYQSNYGPQIHGLTLSAYNFKCEADKKNHIDEFVSGNPLYNKGDEKFQNFSPQREPNPSTESNNSALRSTKMSPNHRSTKSVNLSESRPSYNHSIGSSPKSRLYMMQNDGIMYPLDDHSLISQNLLETVFKPENKDLPKSSYLSRYQSHRNSAQLDDDIELIVQNISQRVFQNLPRSSLTLRSSGISSQFNFSRRREPYHSQNITPRINDEFGENIKNINIESQQMLVDSNIYDKYSSDHSGIKLDTNHTRTKANDTVTGLRPTYMNSVDKTFEGISTRLCSIENNAEQNNFHNGIYEEGTTEENGRNQVERYTLGKIKETYDEDNTTKSSIKDISNLSRDSKQTQQSEHSKGDRVVVNLGEQRDKK